MKRRQHLVFERAVYVDVNISMGPRLVAHQGVNSPASFKPEPAADSTHASYYSEHLIDGHACRSIHAIILTVRWRQRIVRAPDSRLPVT
jgi:hypothetical protein